MATRKLKTGTLAALSSRSAHMYAVNADHFVHLDDPGAVVQAIRDLVEHCQRGLPEAIAPRPDVLAHGLEDCPSG